MQIRVEKPDQDRLNRLGVDSWSPWSCGKETFDWEYDQQETAYVQEGRVTVKTEDGEVTVQAGDLVTFPSGLKCTWQVEEPIRKVYTFGQLNQG